MNIYDVKVIGAGSPILDILVNVKDEFIERHAGGGKGGTCLVNSDDFDKILSKIDFSRKIAPGGSSANTIFGLSQLGVKTAFLGMLGNDENARLYIERYAKMGGDISNFKKNPSLPTGRCLCMISGDSQRTMRTDLAAAMTLSPKDISESDFRGFNLLHMEGYLLFNPELALKILRCAKKNSCKISLDLSSFEVVKSAGKKLKELLSDYVDIVFANEDEASAFSNGGAAEKSLDALSEICEVAAVKLGANGAMIKRGSEKVSVKALKVEAVDTTGAGDMWASGFLYGLLNGKDLETAGNYGSLLGAEVVKIFGADIPESAWSRIRKKILR